jgi:type I site-specific restriction-modification system R (restriction) subunit
MDMNYFLKRLQAGEDMSDIGNEIADLMNEAQAAYEAEEKAKAEALVKALAEKRAREEAAAAEKAKAERKAALLRVLVDTIAEYGALECPDLADMFVADEDDIQALADSMTSIFAMIKMLGAAPVEMKNAKPARPVVAVRSDDDILNDFVKNFLA